MNNFFNVKSEQIGIYVGALLIILLGVFGAWWILTPTWVPVLVNQESSETRIQLQNHLMEWNVPYKENDHGQIIVQEENLVAIRKKLSDVGLPDKSEPGLELFAEAEYGMSEFTQRINYQRAIESEVARTIRAFNDVKHARVHLTLPKESIFRDKRTEPKASVSVQTVMGKKLDQESVQGIKQLVSASVDGLSPEKVIVLDEKGNLISSSEEKVAGEPNQPKNNLEQYYMNKVKELVYGIVQTDEIRVAVDVQHNYDKVKSIKEQIIPSEDGTKGFVKRSRQQAVEQNNESTDKKEKIKNNLALDQEYVFSTERSEIEYASGELEKLSVGIVITKKLEPETVKEIEMVVAAGLGMDESRGDRITVVSVKPVVEEPANEEIVSALNPEITPFKPNGFQETIQDKARTFLLISVVIIVFLLVFIFVLMRRRDKNQPPRLSEFEKEKTLVELKKWLSEEKSEVRS